MLFSTCNLQGGDHLNSVFSGRKIVSVAGDIFMFNADSTVLPTTLMKSDKKSLRVFSEILDGKRLVVSEINDDGRIIIGKHGNLADGSEKVYFFLDTKTNEYLFKITNKQLREKLKKYSINEFSLQKASSKYKGNLASFRNL